MSKCLHLVLCAAAILIDGYDVQTMGLAIPSLAKATGLPPQNFGVVITAGVTGMAVGAIMLAPLADRFGRKLAMVVALLAIALSTLGMTSVEMPIELSGWRFVSGLGLGALLPVTLAQAASIVRPERRTFALTLIAASAGAGSFLAGMSAPSLEKVAGWQGLFYLGALLPLLPITGLLATRAVVGEGRKRASRSESNFEPRSPAVLFSSALRRRTMLICGIFFVSLLATYSLINWLPTLLSLAGWARGDAQRASGLLALGSVLGGLLLAWVSDKGKAAPALTAAFVIAAIALSILANAPEAKVVWLLLLLLIGAGAIGSQLALGSLVASLYPPSIHATAMGLSWGMGRLGSILGPMILTHLIATHASFKMVIGILIFPMVLCAIAVMILRGDLMQKIHHVK